MQIVKNDVMNRKIQPGAAFQKWLKNDQKWPFLHFDPHFLPNASSYGREPIFFIKTLLKSNKYQSLGHLAPKTSEKFKKNTKNRKIPIWGLPEWGWWGTPRHPGVLKMVIKTAERNFVKTVKISTQSETPLSELN